jgi:cell division protein FtsL
MTGRRATQTKRRTVSRGRSIVAVVLVGFVLVASGVIARRVLGVQWQTEIRRLQEKRAALDAERVRLDGAIRDASSRARLQPIAEQKLNMHIPTADQQVILPRPELDPSAGGAAGRAARSRTEPDDSL